MDLVSRRKQYLNLRGIGITQFADECDIPRPTASQLLAGRNKKVSDEIIGKIHFTYPDLSVSWLMFGEGDMVSDTNIKTSEAKQASLDVFQEDKSTNNKDDNPISTGLFSNSESATEKIAPTEESMHQDANEEFSFGKNTFAFSDQTTSAPQPHPSPDNAHMSAGMADSPQPKPITIAPEKGKFVTGIVVYYNDSTYESFVPDPEAKYPFMR